MLEQVASALNRRDYPTAAKLIAALVAQQLPSRGWRLYRLGQMGELEFYRDQLQQAQIPCFCVSQHDTQQVYIFRVSHFQSFHPQPTIVCTDDRSELRTFNFNWSEVTQLVTGMLPIFEEVVEIDARNRTYRKPKILDYVYIYDLQLRDWLPRATPAHRSTH